MHKLNGYVKKALLGMVGIYSEETIRELAQSWHDKGVLTEEDLLEVDGWFAEPTTEEVAQ